MVVEDTCVCMGMCMCVHGYMLDYKRVNENEFINARHFYNPFPPLYNNYPHPFITHPLVLFPLTSPYYLPPLITHFSPYDFPPSYPLHSPLPLSFSDYNGG